MRTVTYGATCSLDGFLARPDGSVELHFSSDASAVMNEYWKGVDTILMGRKTWEVAAKSGGGGGGSGGVKGYLFSRTVTAAPAGMELVRDDAGGFVHRLKEQSGGGICLMGGGDLARSLFEAGVVDEVSVNVHPVLLGAGIRLFLPLTRQVNLELVENRPLDGGCTYLLYRVKR